MKADQREGSKLVGLKALRGALVCLFFLFLFSSTARSDSGIEGKILALIAEETGLPVTVLEVGDLSIKTFPASRNLLYTAKVINTDTGEIHQINVDPSGNQVNFFQALAAEEAAQTDLYGVLQPQLHNLLQCTADDELVRVSVWLKEGHIEPLSRPELSRAPTDIGAGDAPSGFYRP